MSTYLYAHAFCEEERSSSANGKSRDKSDHVNTCTMMVAYYSVLKHIGDDLHGSRGYGSSFLHTLLVNVIIQYRLLSYTRRTKFTFIITTKISACLRFSKSGLQLCFKYVRKKKTVFAYVSSNI